MGCESGGSVVVVWKGFTHASRRHDDCGLVFLSDRHARGVFDRGRTQSPDPPKVLSLTCRSQIPESGVCGGILPVVRHPPSSKKLGNSPEPPPFPDRAQRLVSPENPTVDQAKPSSQQISWRPAPPPNTPSGQGSFPWGPGLGRRQRRDFLSRWQYTREVGARACDGGGLL